jgi:hypothetical protein
MPSCIHISLHIKAYGTAYVPRGVHVPSCPYVPFATHAHRLTPPDPTQQQQRTRPLTILFPLRRTV